MSSPEGTPGENFKLALIRSGSDGVLVWDPVMERETRVRKIRGGYGIRSGDRWYWIREDDAVRNWENQREREGKVGRG